MTLAVHNLFTRTTDVQELFYLPAKPRCFCREELISSSHKRSTRGCCVQSLFVYTSNYIMLSEFCKKTIQREVFKNIAIILAVYGIQVILFKDIFRCTCRNHKSYGLTFLFFPAVFLLVLSLIVCQKFWIVVTTLFKHSNYKTRCNYFLFSLVEFFRPFLAPSSWIIVALFRGECYVCIRVGPGNKCMSDEQEKNSIDFDHYYFQSFILGSACLVSMVIFATGIFCIQRCCTDSNDHLPTYDDLIEAKQNAIVEVFRNRTKEMVKDYAEKIVESSFCDPKESEIDVDERFVHAREKVQAICGHKQASGYMINIPFASMELTSSKAM